MDRLFRELQILARCDDYHGAIDAAHQLIEHELRPLVEPPMPRWSAFIWPSDNCVDLYIYWHEHDKEIH